MPEVVSIACSLSAGDLKTRLAEMADLGADALVASRHDGAQGELRFAAGAGVRDRVDAIVAAESQCCSFLTMSVAEEDDTVVLTIGAPEDAEAAVVELVGAFGSTPTAA